MVGSLSTGQGGGRGGAGGVLWGARRRGRLRDEVSRSRRGLQQGWTGDPPSSCLPTVLIC